MASNPDHVPCCATLWIRNMTYIISDYYGYKQYFALYIMSLSTSTMKTTNCTTRQHSSAKMHAAAVIYNSRTALTNAEIIHAPVACTDKRSITFPTCIRVLPKHLQLQMSFHITLKRKIKPHPKRTWHTYKNHFADDPLCLIYQWYIKYRV